jgi:hypothetical protein
MRAYEGRCCAGADPDSIDSAGIAKPESTVNPVKKFTSERLLLVNCSHIFFPFSGLIIAILHRSLSVT